MPQIPLLLPVYFPSLCLLILPQISHCHSVHTMVQYIQTVPAFSAVTRFRLAVHQTPLPDIPSSVDPLVLLSESGGLRSPVHLRQRDVHPSEGIRLSAYILFSCVVTTPPSPNTVFTNASGTFPCPLRNPRQYSDCFSPS